MSIGQQVVANCRLFLDYSHADHPRADGDLRLSALQGKYTWASYDVSHDGRFLAIVPESLSSEQPLVVVVNWTAERRNPPPR